MSEVDREKEITSIVSVLEKTPAKQHVNAIIRAGLEVVPSVGGVLSTLVEEMLPDWKMKRFQRFVAELAVDLKSLTSKVDVSYVKTEEFGYLFEQTFREVFQEYQHEKLEVLKNILLNSMVRGDVKQETKEYMLSIARSLGVIHMRFISMLDNPTLYYKNKNLQNGSVVPGGSRMQELRNCFPEYDESIIRAVWSDLYRYGLITVSDLGGMIAASGSRVFEGVLSSFGKLLVAFLKPP